MSLDRAKTRLRRIAICAACGRKREMPKYGSKCQECCNVHTKLYQRQKRWERLSPEQRRIKELELAYNVKITLPT